MTSLYAYSRELEYKDLDPVVELSSLRGYANPRWGYRILVGKTREMSSPTQRGRNEFGSETATLVGLGLMDRLRGDAPRQH